MKPRRKERQLWKEKQRTLRSTPYSLQDWMVYGLRARRLVREAEVRYAVARIEELRKVRREEKAAGRR